MNGQVGSYIKGVIRTGQAAASRDSLSIFLQQNGISTGVHYYTPIHTCRCYGNRTFLKTAEYLQDRILTLPLYPDLTDDQVAFVVDKIHQFYNRH